MIKKRKIKKAVSKKVKKLNNYLIVFYGPPGSGKSTQAKMVAEKLRAKLMIMGDMLRAVAKKDTPLGKKAKKVLDDGLLLEDHPTFLILEDYLRDLKSKSKMIFDGFPRTIGQARLLDELLAQEELKNKFLFIYVRLTKATVLKRLAFRRMCMMCGAIGQLKTANQKLMCKKCKSPMTQRIDETPRAINNRLVVYTLQSRLLKKYYGKRIKKINGDDSIKNIYNNILKIIYKQLA